MVRRKVRQMGQVRRGGIVNYELGTSYMLAPAGEGDEHEFRITASFGELTKDSNQVQVIREIKKAYFVNEKGTKLQKIGKGEIIRVCIESEGMIGANIRYIIWENDSDAKKSMVYQSGLFKLWDNIFFCNEIKIDQEFFERGYNYFWEKDTCKQNYSIEVQTFSNTKKSNSFKILFENIEVSHGKSVVRIDSNNKKNKVIEEVCLENILILRSDHRKGKGQDGKNTHLDLMYKDYSEDINGFNKLWHEIHNEYLDVNGPSTNPISNILLENKAIDRANLVVNKIESFCDNTNEQLFRLFYNTVEYYSMGELEDVIHLMVSKMKNNSTNTYEFSDDRLDKSVRKHINHRNFVDNVITN